jgi:hypothetical protein
MSFGDVRKLAITAAIVLVGGLITPISASAIDDPCLSSTAIIGTPGDDVITGTPGDDIICTLAGNDTIEGLAGDDIIIAGDGDDRIIAMEGNDYIEAGDGDDFVDGGAGDDEILGNPGDDILWGGLGIDELLGLAGNDTLDGGAGADSVDGGLDRNYCVKDSKDKKALSCFYDNKAPALRSASVSANTRSIDTSVTAQWVRVKALITEAGSGLTDVGFTFVNFQSKSMPSFGAFGSLKYPDRLPTTCSSLKSLSETPPPNSLNPKSHWCIEQQSSSAVVVEFLIAAPYRLAKGTYKLAGLILNDGALNQSSQNGLWFKASVRQTASVPSGIPVLKSFEFLSNNRVSTANSSAQVSAEVTVSTGPVGLGGLTINFVRDVDRKFGDNLVYMMFNPENSSKPCDTKVPKAEQKESCLISNSGGVVKAIIVTTVPKNSPAGTYRFSVLSISSETGKGTELDSENLKKDSRYEKFTKLAIVQTAASVPFKADGSIELVGISTDVKKIDTGSGPASFDVQINIRRTGAADKWPVTGVVHAMHCPSGNIRKFNSLTSKSNFGVSIQAGEYCSELRNEGTGKRWWPDVMAANTISFAQFTLPAGSNTASVKLTIPANFRKGMIIAGLDQMSVNMGDQKFSTIRGNWVSIPSHAVRNAFPGTLTCGIYPSCTQHYSVLQNGQ